MKIPILDLTPEIEKHGAAYTQAVDRVIRSGQFIMGENVRSLESELAEFLNVKHVVTMNSGTDALVIGLRALGVKPGDEVLVPSFTFFASAEAVTLIGATPVFCDVDLDTFNVSLKELEKKLSPKTKAVIPVHLFGQPADMDPINEFAKKRNLKVLEDACQAIGAEYRGKRVGGLGDAAAFSFFPSKNLGAFGDGGCLATNDDQVADQARLLRVHGSRKRYHHEDIGYASRLDEIQAAILRVKLPHLEARNAGRQAAAKRYHELFAKHEGIIAPITVSQVKHVFHQYTVRLTHANRDQVQAKLAEQGISTMIYYPIPIHQTDPYNKVSAALARTELLASQVLSLPIWPEITSEIQLVVGEKLLEAVK